MEEEISQQRGAIGAHWYTNNLPENRAPKTNVDVVEKTIMVTLDTSFFTLVIIFMFLLIVEQIYSI